MIENNSKELNEGLTYDVCFMLARAKDAIEMAETYAEDDKLRIVMLNERVKFLQDELDNYQQQILELDNVIRDLEKELKK